MDETSYITNQKNLYNEYENICRQCGLCCGLADGDPCRNLIEIREGIYYCKIYKNRFGPQKTVRGNIFTCVPIRNLIKFGSAPPNCAYR